MLKSRHRCRIDNIKILEISGLSIEMSRCKNKKGEEDYLIVVTNTVAHQALKNYKKRWSIEALFQDFKKQGFNLEDSHLNKPYKICQINVPGECGILLMLTCRFSLRERKRQNTQKKTWI